MRLFLAGFWASSRGSIAAREHDSRCSANSSCVSTGTGTKTANGAAGVSGARGVPGGGADPILGSDVGQQRAPISPRSSTSPALPHSACRRLSTPRHDFPSKCVGQDGSDCRSSRRHFISTLFVLHCTTPAASIDDSSRGDLRDNCHSPALASSSFCTPLPCDAGGRRHSMRVRMGAGIPRLTLCCSTKSRFLSSSTSGAKRGHDSSRRRRCDSGLLRCDRISPTSRHVYGHVESLNTRNYLHRVMASQQFRNPEGSPSSRPDHRCRAKSQNRRTIRAGSVWRYARNTSANARGWGSRPSACLSPHGVHTSIRAGERKSSPKAQDADPPAWPREGQASRYEARVQLHSALCLCLTCCRVRLRC